MSVTVVATSMRGRHYPPLSKNHAYRRRGIVIDCQAALACRSTLPDDATRDEAFNARRWLIAALVLVLIIGAGYMAFTAWTGGAYLVNAAAIAGCQTPANRYGWSYVAINYDIADDSTPFQACTEVRRRAVAVLR
jgi:hypothetical protein